MAVRQDLDQVVGPDGSIISEVAVEREVPDPVDHEALLAAIAGARTLPELQVAVVEYLGKDHAARQDRQQRSLR